ncbi:MAG TPA: ABC transporter permease [Gammaproteobacteria bacterium]|nr:ABC transporter permease [Gammaproteobacteria bacterium]
MSRKTAGVLVGLHRESRAMHVVSYFDSVGRDLRFALRALLRRPAFASAAVVTLALGIGATTAIFSVVYSVLIKPLPYPNADDLVTIRHPAAGLNIDDMGAGPTMYFTYRDENRTFADVGLWQTAGETLTGFGEPERLTALRVTDGTLQALGVQPMRGRWFTQQEYRPSAEGPEPVILTYAFWQRRFGGDEAGVERELSIDSRPSQIVGVMPPGFRFLDLTPQPDVIVAARLDPAKQVIGEFGYHMLARLKSGVTPDEARADVDRMLPIWLRAWPLYPGVSLSRDAIANWRISADVRPLRDDVVGTVASTLWVIMGAIGAVLLVACANVANLMLVRADARREELALRRALGAVPRRIARELFVESLCLGAAGGLLGLLLAYVGLRVLIAVAPSDLPRLQEISVYPPVLEFTVAVSLASTLVFGSITALKHALAVDTATIGRARGSSASRERSATRNTLVVAQVALALVLAVSAALMIRTFQSLRDVEPGFTEPAAIQTARLWMPNALTPDPKQDTRAQHEMLDRIAALPGVASAAFASALPMDGQRGRTSVVVEGQALAPGVTPPPREMKFVSPGYFEAMGTRLLVGRDVSWSDIEAGGRVALISEDFARELAPDPAGALGKRIRLPLQSDAWREVIGVVENVHEDGLYEEARSTVYWPLLMESFLNRPAFGTPAAALVIRSKRAGTASLMGDVRQAVSSVNANVPLAQPRTMQELYAGSLARTSFVLVMLAIAGGMALALGVVGIYGVIAYVVSQRKREIGIRSALGADPGRLERMFLLQGLALCGVGALAGLASAAALGRSMSSLLFGVGPMDPAAYAAALAVTVAAAALAAYLPARRAAKVDPVETLKAE